jgi:hypothetical protein
MSGEFLAYYRAGLALLKHVEARQPTTRRFGAEADALWSQFKGELTTLDRLEILLRDADGQWPGAFGARTVFALRGVAEDDAFGPEWKSISGVDAEQLWRSQNELPANTVDDVLRAIAQAWRLKLEPVEVGVVRPAERIVVVGASATAELIRAFAGKSDLDWAEQVTVVAASPSVRQIAAAASAILSATKPTRIVAPQAADLGSIELDAERSRLKGKAPRTVYSVDASGEELLAAKSLAGAA